MVNTPLQAHDALRRVLANVRGKDPVGAHAFSEGDYIKLR
jgi:hypothetical protein